MKPIIKVENLGKQYQIGASQQPYLTFRDALSKIARAPMNLFRRNGHSDENTFWALKDVSFEVRPGEVIGIIGRNGAGKSTLLKILSRITEPTTGKIDLYGRVGSLLEVGTGFHPELTGRENISLNGAILGMKRNEIERKFDEIVEFAEIEKFLDTPVKHYSSGMYVRLAFAVAAHLDPEILVVDEVLAVGDLHFQKKCLGKMSDVAEEGRTVLFVSHNMTAVQSFCTRAMVINEGKVVEEGMTASVVSKYLQSSFSALTEQVWEDLNSAPGNDKVRLHRVCVRPENGYAWDSISIRTSLVMEFEYWNFEPNSHLNLSVVVFDEAGIVVFNTGPLFEPNWGNGPFPVGLFRSKCYIPGDLLNDGMHRVSLHLVKDQNSIIFTQEDALTFDVQDSVEMRGNWHGKWVGAVRPNLEWRTELLASGDRSAIETKS